MGILDSLKPKKSISEIEEETEQLEAENRKEELNLSVYEKRAAIARLKQDGLKPAHFSFDWKNIMNYIKSH